MIKKKRPKGVNEVSWASGLLKPGRHYLQGNEACIEGALVAGCRVYAGYPITPATEAMEAAARRFPEVGGRFIQMEDEIGSACVLIGASWGGAKALTVTSSPGFSLMQEAISIGIISETPMVIIDIQRPGPGQGYITASQEDVMQARWGHHGEGPIIALAPSSVQEMFEVTIEAFNLSERWRTPVLVMAEETVAHMRESVVIPPLEAIEIIDRKKPQDLGISPEEYYPWGHDVVAPMANWGEGYNVNFVGLVHLEDGNVTRYSPEMNRHCIERLHKKIEVDANSVGCLDTKFLEDCKHVMICYGVVSRTAMEAVAEAREGRGLKIGYIRLRRLWPFPEEQLRNVVCDVDTVFVPEMNLGMMKHPITEALRDRCKKIVSIPSIGMLHSPDYILSEVYKDSR
jgi:2-oxoglutarate/2-oxoacid ferredoxin oxidoreductase subunit alpha